MLKHSLVYGFLAIVAAGSANAQSTILSGPGLTSLARTYSLPPVGLASTETLQINVANLATAPTGASSSATASCSGTISFSNSSGKAIGSPVQFAVPSGQIYSATLPFSSTGYTSRGEILAAVQQSISIPATGSCAMAVTLETFDSTTGVTHIVLTSPATTVSPFQVVLSSSLIP